MNVLNIFSGRWNKAPLLRFFGVSVGKGSKIYSPRIVPGVRIGRFCEVHQDTVIRSDVNLGDYCIIREGSILCESRLDSCVTVGRNALLSRLTAGENTQIEYGVLCTGHGNGRITIGKECYIGIRAVLDWSDSVTIGNYVHIAGPAVGIWTHTSVKQALAGHGLSNKSLRETAPVVIRDNVYIGGHTIIYPGVTIGDHAVILPNSAVNEDVPAWTMVGGVPAKLIRKIDPEFFGGKKAVESDAAENMMTESHQQIKSCF